MKKYIHIFILPLLFAWAFHITLPGYALPADFFAKNSVLAEGKWVRMEAEKTGIQFIPAATLRSMGFTDPSKVNVYGAGGRMLPEKLDATITDDLPLLPCVRNERGLYFFGTDVTSWQSSNEVPYTHTLNPYDTKSYYFLSDRELPYKKEMAKVGAPATTAGALKTFTERLYHESELAGFAETGRTLFGEDFRNTRSRSFPFTLTGLAGDSAIIKVRFGAKSSTASSIMVSANGTRLPSTTSDNINESTSEAEFLRAISSIKTIKKPAENLNIEISYSSTGNVSAARLDYIEVFYERELRLSNGFLNFYSNDPESPVASIEGCSANTRIWDVTDPANPQEMEFVLSGSTATIALSDDYHEYVAFEPDKVTQSQISWQPVSNQDIHGMETPDMVIITYNTYMDAARRLATLHEEHDGMKVVVLEPEYIYNEFSGGSADVTAFRKMLKMWHDRGGERNIRYCLLMGRAYFDNRVLTNEAKNLSYRPMPIWQEPSLFTDAGSYSTDSYIAMLDDCPKGFSMASAKHHVAVGRLPVKSSDEANAVASKIEKYVKEPNYGAWRNKMMIVADDIDDASMASSKPENMNTFMDQSQSIYTILSSSKEGKKYIYDRVYLDAHKLETTSVGLRYPTAKAKMLSNWNEGVVFTNYLGHASASSWSHEKILTLDDINSFSNRNLTFLFGGTCEFAHWDGNTVSGGELLVLNPTAGAIAMVMPSRTVYITQNYQLNKAMAPYLLKENENGDRPRIGDFFRRGMNDLADSNKLRYCLLGDPAIAFPLPTNIVQIETINGMDVSENATDFPEIPALGKVEVKGHIVNSKGEKDNEFTGILEIILFDAEKVVSTKGMGKGLDRTYNDRKTRLTTVSVRVENGEWSARFMLPAEIENNYSPALITAYAWNETTGEEAHGMTENLYVYGYNEDAAIDDKAPVIESFYLNNPALTNGAVVNANPIVFATFSDESGINVSDAGIGHQMVLTLDGKKVFNDLNIYFTADPSREGAGSICYPLADLEPGKHTLALSVWDNANNSATSKLEFNVGAAVDPVITDLSTNVNPASTSVVFAVTIDRPNSNVECNIEVFDLSGRNVWKADNQLTTDMQSSLNVSWDLKDKNGVRVPRGIYLYRATVRTPEGTYSSKSRKLAVTAQ
ncbi:MAG: type IX secretion system sortase PorU [Muribaculaceae bacterium]|nr:type IX secretion system sortase PorU [Muribaculaceae bacterium]